jgi:uncharacterized membrane protein
MHPLTLSFHDSETERAFVRYMLPRWRDQGRAAIIVGISIYLLYGALDHLFIPVEQLSMVWAIRLSAVLFAVGVLVLTFSPWFEKINQIPLALVGLVASLGLIAILWHLPAGGSAYYFPGLMLAAFYTYDLLGVRFILALAVNLLVLVLVSFVFAYFKFTWSLRQFNLLSILVGAAPMGKTGEPGIDAYAHRVAGANNLAGDDFNRGIRAYYFGLAATGWLLNSWALGLLSVIVLVVLFRRDYRSPALRVLRD